jgi:hypothetical protein
MTWGRSPTCHNSISDVFNKFLLSFVPPPVPLRICCSRRWLASSSTSNPPVRGSSSRLLRGDVLTMGEDLLAITQGRPQERVRSAQAKSVVRDLT